MINIIEIDYNNTAEYQKINCIPNINLIDQSVIDDCIIEILKDPHNMDIYDYAGPMKQNIGIKMHYNEQHTIASFLTQAYNIIVDHTKSDQHKVTILIECNKIKNWIFFKPFTNLLSLELKIRGYQNQVIKYDVIDTKQLKDDCRANTDVLMYDDENCVYFNVNTGSQAGYEEIHNYYTNILHDLIVNKSFDRVYERNEFFIKPRMSEEEFNNHIQFVD